jgi:prenyltransferase beta subunit
MLQVARLAPRQLGESRDLVAGFLRTRLNPDGGFQDRTGKSDLYYTVFGIEGLIALQEPVPSSDIASFLRGFGHGGDLDFIHLCCLARCWAGISRDVAGAPTHEMLSRLNSFREGGGGFGNAYRAFLAVGAYQDLQSPVPDPERVLRSLEALRAADGGYANRSGEAHGLTTVTAAAAMLLKTLDGTIDPHLTVWLLDRLHSSGGFLAAPSAPAPDLLSTATGLHALAAMHAPLEGVHEACLDFVDSLWTNRGGFYGSWLDDTLDCEYTYYGLLALGHLTVAAPSGAA